MTIAHPFGWRMQSEVTTLELRQVDLEVGTIRLDPGQTKNDEGRIVSLTPELKTLLTAQVAWVTAWRKAGFAVTVKENGTKVIRPLFIRHDFRRTGVRTLVNAGVPERVAMTITGHKTRAVFDRYHFGHVRAFWT